MTDPAASIDLNAYCARIGYVGAREATLDVLKALHWAHALSIPFENLDVLARRPIQLDMRSLQKKLIADRRGGYCFEVNALFVAALRAIGFEVTTLIGRVRWKAPAELETNRSHMLSVVDLPEGRFLVDIGFGGLTMTGPIPFVTDRELETPHEPRRLMVHGEGYELQAKLADDWVPIYRFTMEPNGPVDYEQASWFTSTHPSSIFVQFLIVARPTDEGRVTLFNTNLTIRHRDGEVETRQLETEAAIADALATHFDLPLTPADQALMLTPYLESWRAL
ncbi:MAG: arylamine N-acetyltransferase [Rhizobiales bacterium]|nr:arylamine N-acetyltransferase [Hyphomicrobiales bacterium]